jgi:hypothetical protein
MGCVLINVVCFRDLEFFFLTFMGFFSYFFCRVRLVAVATQKFVADVATDALQYVLFSVFGFDFNGF